MTIIALINELEDIRDWVDELRYTEVRELESDIEFIVNKLDKVITNVDDIEIDED